MPLPKGQYVLRVADGTGLQLDTTEFKIVGRKGFRVRVTAIPNQVAGKQPGKKAATPKHRPSPLDNLKRADIPLGLLATAGGGDADKAPPELVAVLGEERFRIPGRTAMGYFDLSADGRVLAVSREAIVLVDATTGKYLRSITEPNAHMVTVKFSPDGKWLAGATHFGMTGRREIWLWDVAADYKHFATLTEVHGVENIAFSPDSKQILSAAGAAVRVWDVKTQKIVLHLKGHKQTVFGVGFSPDQKWILTAGEDNTVKIWDAKTGQEIHTLNGFVRHPALIRFSPKRDMFAVGAIASVRIWNATTLKEIRTLETPGSGMLAFSDDGKSIYTAGVHFAPGTINYIKRWDLSNGKELASFGKDYKGGWGFYYFSPDQQKIYATQQNATRYRVYDAKTGKELFPRRGHTHAVRNLSISPDGKLLASATNGIDAAKLWDLTKGKLIDSRGGNWVPPPNEVLFSPNGKLLYFASPNWPVCHLTDTRSGKIVKTLPGFSLGYSVFNPSGEALATAHFTGTIMTILDTTTGKTKQHRTFAKAPVARMAYGPKNKYFATCHRDGTVRLLDLENQRERTI